ncbi:MAG: hypothetical protein IIA45_10330 [Bacteroidetes bacterium]|nr:hypothetical protein [Bacteroidota bacterium]
MKIIQILTLLLVIGTVIMSSCKKRGCKQTYAFNYDVDADKANNKLCTYQRTFWDDHTDSTGWIDVWVARSDSLGAEVFYEGTISIFYPGTTPDCEMAVGCAVIDRKPGTYDYEIENNKGNTDFGVVIFRDEACRLFEVNY